MRSALTAIGATALLGAPMTAVTVALVEARLAPPPGGGPPPWFPEFTAVPFAVGAFLALGLGGWRALAAVAAVAGIGAWLQLWNIALWALGPQGYVVPGLSHTEIPRHLWPFTGVALGAVAYAVSPRPLFRASTVLAAIGISVVANAVAHFLFLFWWDVPCYSPSGLARCDANAFAALSHLIVGVLLGLVLPRSAPVPAVLAVLAVLALPSAVIVAYQGWMVDPPFGVLAIGGGVLTSVVAALIFAARGIGGGTGRSVAVERTPV